MPAGVIAGIAIGATFVVVTIFGHCFCGAKTTDSKGQHVASSNSTVLGKGDLIKVTPAAQPISVVLDTLPQHSKVVSEVKRDAPNQLSGQPRFPFRNSVVPVASEPSYASTQPNSIKGASLTSVSPDVKSSENNAGLAAWNRIKMRQSGVSILNGSNKSSPANPFRLKKSAPTLGQDTA